MEVKREVGAANFASGIVSKIASKIAEPAYSDAAPATVIEY